MTEPSLIAGIADDLPIGVWVARAPGGEFVWANRAFVDIIGMGARSDVAVGEYAQAYGIHTPTGELYPEDRMPFVRAVAERGTVTVDDIVVHRTDGRKVAVRAFAKPIFDADGEMTHVVVAFIDISREQEAERAREETEARLPRAQRMESIGNLAGGIAHDFNNLLATVQLVCTRLRLGETDAAKLDDLRLIEEVTNSAAQLTRSLLGFAGRGKYLAGRVALSHVARSMVELLQRTIDRRIEVVTDLASSSTIIGDFSQLEQVLMNLMMNARDAMPRGGRLTVRTYDRKLFDAEAASRAPLRAGPHVVLEVCDSGVGIDPAIRDRIFEPYFTTKTSGAVRGTGLGLATVWGIVETHGGAIEVLDNPPRGTTMRVLFPAAPPAPAAATVESAAREVRPGRGTILVVDDEPLMRSALSRALRSIGYDALSAENGEQAVAIYRSRRREIVAVVLDMVMPHLDGRGTYLALREIDPDVAVLLTTGYSLNEEAQQILDLGVRGFLPKPAGVQELSEALAKVIG